MEIQWADTEVKVSTEIDSGRNGSQPFLATVLKSFRASFDFMMAMLLIALR